MVTLTFDINKDPKNFKKATYTNEKMPIQQNAKFSNHIESKCWQFQNIHIWVVAKVMKNLEELMEVSPEIP